MWNWLKGWKHQWRMRPKVGPFRFNLSNWKWTSTSVEVGEVTHNIDSGTTTINTWGPGSLVRRGTKRRTRRKNRRRER